MKIEVLFPEICNLYGDLANVRYLTKCLPDAEVIETGLQTKPRFLDEEIDLVYMGTTTERGQILALEQLRLHRQEILDRIEDGTHFLVTGNAMELFADRIVEDGEEIAKGLGLFPGVVKRSSVNRFNSLYLGDFTGSPAKDSTKGPAKDSAKEPIKIVGFKSQFGHMYTDEGDQGLDHLALFKTLRGPGMNRYAKGEGIRINNFLATYVIGPLLILNPPFTRWLIEDMTGDPIDKLAYEEAAMDSYSHRVNEYSDPETGLYYWGGTSERWQ